MTPKSPRSLDRFPKSLIGSVIDLLMDKCAPRIYSMTRGGLATIGNEDAFIVDVSNPNGPPVAEGEQIISDSDLEDTTVE